MADTIGTALTPVAPTDWEHVEEELGLALPSDYKAFIDAYGPGTYCNIEVCAPDGPSGFTLSELLDKNYNSVKATQMGVPPVHPDINGMIAWGQIVDGDIIGWVPVTDDPEQWGLIIRHTSGLIEQAPNYSFSTFLARLGRDLDFGMQMFGWERPPAERVFRSANKTA